MQVFNRPSGTISAYGYDAEDVDREIATDNQRADELGLVFDSDPRHDQPIATVSGPVPKDSPDAIGPETVQVADV